MEGKLNNFYFRSA